MKKLIVNSCKDCSDRNPFCHIDCERYIKSKQEYGEFKSLIKVEKELDNYKTQRHNLKRDKHIKKYGKAY